MNIDKEPTKYEMIIFTWVFLPVAIASFAWMLIDVSIGRNKCEKICTQKQYSGFRYAPDGRYGIGGRACYCLTESETKIKDRIPEGKRVF